MTKVLKLTDKEIIDLSHRIAEPSFKFFKKLLIKELDYAQKDGDININDFIHLMLITLSSFDANAMIMTRNTFKYKTGKEIDFVNMMELYFNDLMSIMTSDDRQRLRAKMN
jgi:hypothetical protein